MAVSRDEGEGTPLLPLVQPLLHIYQSNAALCRVFRGFVKKKTTTTTKNLLPIFTYSSLFPLDSDMSP